MKVIADYDGTNGIFSATLDIAGKCSVKSILTDENGTVIAESNEKESVNWTIENRQALECRNTESLYVTGRI